jgi:uncharacterized protein
MLTEGQVLWFEDQEALDALKSANPAVAPVVTEWSDHSNGMHQFLGSVPMTPLIHYVFMLTTNSLVWSAFELEGLGCNLQHYNFSPDFTKEVQETWGLPKTWALKSQLVFGEPQDGLKRRMERTYLPLEERVKMVGS